MITKDNWNDYKNKRVWAMHPLSRTKEPAILLHYDSNLAAYVLFSTARRVAVLSNTIKALDE